jgi:cytochrome c553
MKAIALALRVSMLGLLVVPSAQAQAVAGREKVTRICAVCHGVNGMGVNPDVPHIAGESPLYLEKQLKAFRSGERKHEQMSIIAQGLSDDDIRDLVSWYSSLKISVEMPK